MEFAWEPNTKSSDFDFAASPMSRGFSYSTQFADYRTVRM
jgi:hypothetical protein